MLEERGLEAHKDKTGYILLGSKEYKAKMSKELKCSNFKVQKKSPR